MPETVAIIGAGVLGRWLAQAAAQVGYRVLLEDVMPANLHHAQELLRQQLGRAELPEVAFVSTIEEAVRDADLVIDCVPDELESKLEILWLLDRMAPPRTVFATPTMHLSIADLAACTYRQEKCAAIAVDANTLTAHPAPAASARPEILLTITSCTTVQTVALLSRFWRNLGFVPRFQPDPAEVPR